MLETLRASLGPFSHNIYARMTLSTIKENESLKDFMKRFGQAVLQVESYNMDVILQIFKRNIPSTPFFESLAKKPPATMDDLFRRADKYYMLKDDVRAASQQVLVTNRPTKNNEARSSKPLNQLRQASKRWVSQQHGRNPSRQIRLSEIGIEGAYIIRIMVIPPSNARVSITWWRN
ncbi:hypothetical protein CK203_111998 [Vitis vinifera]|uniref:Retrotransposon gag domain-containing protein n=1 Tax=Vitis vinifera TaxID=29760 RepID=A0A438C4N9_VITVI|nr:hypothetical protein CK203_111998 [Vitis vinifera]